MTADSAVAGQSRAALEHQDRLRALDELQLLRSELEQRFDRITYLAQRLLRVPVATVDVIDAESVRATPSQGPDLRLAPPAEALRQVATSSRQDLFVVEDLRADRRFAAKAQVVGGEAVRFFAAHRLRGADGQSIGSLCLLDDQPRRLSAVDREVLRALASYVQDELQRNEDVEHAARMQQGLLPKRAPVLPGYQVAGVCIPARVVGGDLYDYYPMPDGVGFTVADVMGKGVGASIMAATVRAVLRSAVRNCDVAEAVNHAQKVLQVDLAETETFVTLMHARVEALSGRVRYVDAGHGLSVVVREEGAVERLRHRGLPLGARAEEEWSSHEVTLGAGDSLVTFSDGVLELLGDDLARLQHVIELMRTFRAPDELVDHIAGLARHVRLLDDVTVVAVRRCPA